MRKSKAKGARFQIIGYIVFFTCWIIPAALSEVFSIEGIAGSIVMIGQMGIGGFLILFGGMVNKKTEEDPGYVIPKNFFRVFKPWQLLLMAAVITFLALFCIKNESEKWLVSWLLFMMFGLPICAVIFGIINRMKNEAAAVSKRYARKNAVTRCGRCGKTLNPDDVCTHNGEYYCSACYLTVSAEENTEKQKTAGSQTACSVCERTFPQSSLHIINDRFVCDECFQNEFPADIQ